MKTMEFNGEESPKQIAMDNNDESKDKSVDQLKKKYHPILRLEIGRYKKQKYFLGKDKKLAQTFKGPVVLTNANTDVTVLIKSKGSKHDE